MDRPIFSELTNAAAPFATLESMPSDIQSEIIGFLEPAEIIAAQSGESGVAWRVDTAWHGNSA